MGTFRFPIVIIFWSTHAIFFTDSVDIEFRSVLIVCFTIWSIELVISKPWNLGQRMLQERSLIWTSEQQTRSRLEPHVMAQRFYHGWAEAFLIAFENWFRAVTTKNSGCSGSPTTASGATWGTASPTPGSDASSCRWCTPISLFSYMIFSYFPNLFFDYFLHHISDIISKILKPHSEGTRPLAYFDSGWTKSINMDCSILQALIQWAYSSNWGCSYFLLFRSECWPVCANYRTRWKQ